MPPLKSEVWKHFTKENATEVKCRVCGKNLRFCNNTSNMMQHLKLKHSKDAETLKVSRTIRLKNKFSKTFLNRHKQQAMKNYISAVMERAMSTKNKLQIKMK